MGVLIRALIGGPLFGVFLTLVGLRTAVGETRLGSGLYLTTVCFIAFLLVGGTILVTRKGPLRVEGRIRRAVVVGLVMILPMGLLVFAGDLVFAAHKPPVSELPIYLYKSVIFSAFISALAGFLSPSPTPSPPPTADGEPRPVRFLDRLPPRLRGAELWAVEAEDHYLRLHTSKGADLILMRLSDAIAELDGIDGAQTHRSWWVAKAAVRGVKRADGRATLTLPDGTEAPVSRAQAKGLREAGWY